MKVISFLSDFAVPAIFIVILFTALLNKVKAFDVFVEGAKEGFYTVIKILPSLVGLLVAVSVFKASGALDIFIWMLKPAIKLLQIPAEVAPLGILRPISGSASFAFVAEIIKAFGPDSQQGRIAAVMMGSTETIFYTLTVYYGAVGIKKIRYTLGAALIADLISIIASVWACKFIFG